MPSKKRSCGASFMNPHVKRRKVARGVDFVGEEREELEKLNKQLVQMQENVNKYRKIIFDANKQLHSLNEDVEDLTDRKKELEKIISENDKV